MTRFADPSRCPDCARPISGGDPACRSCALPLRGETAQKLYVALVTADGLLADLRASAGAAAVPVRESPTPLDLGATPSDPHHPAAAPPRPTARPLGSSAVPRILLGLGATCLLVAAAVFLAVAWSALGIGGRTAVLVALTAGVTGLAATAARRGLRVAAEAMTCVALGLLTLDLVGARGAGWWGDLSDAGLTLLVGAALVAAGLAGARAAQHTAVERLVAAQLAVAGGAALGTLGLVAGPLPLAAALVLAVLATVLVAGVAHRLDLSVAATGCVVVAGAAWLALAVVGLDRVLDRPSWRALWVEARAWPLLVAAAFAAAPAALRRLPHPAGLSCLGVSELLLVTAVLAPVTRWEPTAQTLVALAVLVLAGLAARASSVRWSLVQAPVQLVAGATVTAVTGGLIALAGDRIGDAATLPWAGRADDRLPAAVTRLDGLAVPQGWLVPLCLLALLGTAWVVAGSARGGRPGGSTTWLLGAALGAGSGLAVTLVLTPAPVALATAALLGLGGAALVAWDRSGSSVRRATSLTVVVVALAAAGVLSLHAELLSATATTAVLLLAAVVHLRSRVAVAAATAGAVLAVAAAAAAWSWSAVLDVSAPWAATTGLLVLGTIVLLAPYAPRRTAPQDLSRVRAGLEAAAALATVVLSAVGVNQTRDPALWAAVLLTVAGTVVTLMSRLQRDRRALGGVGIGLLTAATWVRLLDLGISAPEAYTLPLALVLLVVGLRSIRDRTISSTHALGPGLGLALLPSLLWVWSDPTGPRPLLLGLACLLLVLAGVRLGWTAPLVLGAGTGALLVLRLAAPYVDDALPRWVLVGAAGALLVALGTTWEHRLAEARTARDYVLALR